MRVKELISCIEAVSVEGPLDREVLGINYDSRRITPGMVFIAVPGQHFDGHDFIPDAVSRGVSAVVCERDAFVPPRVAKILVKDAREALALISCVYYDRPSRKMKVIGITGTNGKTTISFILKRMLEVSGIRTGLIGTIRYEIGERMIPAQRTTPEALDLQSMLSQMVRAGCKACVLEVSSHSLHQKRVLGIGFDVALFTNLTQDHLDYHGGMEPYFESKKKLFDGLREDLRPNAAVVNIDDKFGARLIEESKAAVNMTYGLSEPAMIKAINIRLGRLRTAMRVTGPGFDFDCTLNLIGRHNVYNVLAAIGASAAMNVKCDFMKEALESFPSVPGRLERLDCGQPFGVFVDYAHTDDALKNVLDILREVTPGKLILAFGCGGNRDPGKRPRMGEAAARLADFTIITSDNPRKEAAADIAEQIENGFKKVKTSGYIVELDRRRAIDTAIRSAHKDDTVLIAGKGHETYQEFEDTVVPFDDRIHACEVLGYMGFKENRKENGGR
ncbi:MAG: UDP-N-acetylmuramoyl-L-alanyl-D-glutamate--2,6-diaminopimelate ligase [Verrucomicrobia bacterium]|nr:UDP-N-acetylmuramoyl-L-alanyl-D-glutamate--2,6-diaminopimelate ligase [Verrucomicrobiota bacterium]MCF7708867.1 UDP-N-acetylmuramoyl-L-alanyl-D-glutamate--2,6-diaminopimelate ligase [Verrucomicrobiota bacterium]